MAGHPSSSPAGRPAQARTAATSYTILQMNLCLSGLAGCYPKVAYPAMVDEAVARIRQVHPDAVTLNEACRHDAARIAERSGYRVRFSKVVYQGALLPCISPGGRGLFGDAVLTKAAVESSDNRAFRVQTDIEERRWLCVTTRRHVDVCTSHLNTRETSTAEATNNAQCAELSDLLARRARVRAVVFGGDLNRLGSCAPSGFWTRTDRTAGQDPGIQHVYGSRTLRSPAAQVLPLTHSDHDALAVRASLRGG